MRTFGTGQTNGLPLLLTAVDAAHAQTLHTCPVGSATPHRVRLVAQNLDQTQQPRQLTIQLFNASGTLVSTFTSFVPFGADAFDVLADKGGAGELVLNGTTVIKAYGDAANLLAVSAIVDDQGTVAGIVSQNIASGLIAAVQNASRFGVNVNGGAGQATRANGEIIMSRAGVLKNLTSVSDATIGGGATVTTGVYINGVLSALSNSLAAADTNVAKTNTNAVSVSKGDKVTFGVACDNAGAPAANIHNTVEFT